MGAPATPPSMAPTLLSSAPATDVFLARATGGEPGESDGRFEALTDESGRRIGAPAGTRARGEGGRTADRAPGRGAARPATLGSKSPLQGRTGQVRSGAAGEGRGSLSASTLLTRATVEGRGAGATADPSSSGQVQRAPVTGAQRTELTSRERGGPSTAATGRAGTPPPSFAARSRGRPSPAQGLRRPETATLRPGGKGHAEGAEPGAVVTPAAAGKDGDWSPQVLDFVGPPKREERAKPSGAPSSPARSPAPSPKSRKKPAQRSRSGAPSSGASPSAQAADEERVKEKRRRPTPSERRKAPPPSWRAPVARPSKAVQQQEAPAVPPPAEGRQALEELAESELIQVLRGMTVRSPEARQLLKDIQKQIDEYWRIEELRRIS